MKNILLLHSDTGGGHRAGAQAVISAIEELYPGEFNLKMVDIFAECSDFLNIFAKLYSPVINKAPWLWKMMYYFLGSAKRLSILEKISAPFILKGIENLIVRENPDLIVSVHPLVNHLTVAALKNLKRKTPFAIVILDPLTFHISWAAPGLDLYIVGTDEGKTLAIKFGVPQDKIKVLGVPIGTKFFKPQKSKEELRLEDGLDPKKFTLLMMGGGEGAGGLKKFVDPIRTSNLDIQLVIIAGRNKGLEDSLKKDFADSSKVKAKIYGFTDQVPRIMAQSDMIVTKAGPGTIAESLAMKLPIVITSWIPGQEEGNLDFIRNKGFGRVCTDPEKIVETIVEMSEPKHYEEFLENIKSKSHPKAVFDIATALIKLI